MGGGADGSGDGRGELQLLLEAQAETVKVLSPEVNRPGTEKESITT